MANTPVTGGHRGPIHNFRWLGGAGATVEPLPWALSTVEEGVFEVVPSTILRGEGSVTAVLTNDTPDATFVLEAGSIIYLEWTGLDPSSFSIKSASSWPGASGRMFTEAGDPAVMDKGYFPLWRIHDEEADDRVLIGDGIYAQRLGIPSPLQVSVSQAKTSEDEWIDITILEAGPGAIV